MTLNVPRRAVLAGGLSLAAAPALAAPTPDLQPVLDYAQSQRTTGFLVVQDRKVLARANWAPPADATAFRNAYTYGTTPGGELLEDVASQQKSFVSVLAAVAVDRGLLDVERPVSTYVGDGWSKAAPDQERAIRVIHLLTMCSGLGERLDYQAPAGATFFYNTPAYAVVKQVIAAAAKTPLETLTRTWLTEPLGMSQTAWRERPAVFASSGNPTGLVTCPTDVARFGQFVLDGGRAADGKRLVSDAGMRTMFARSANNPAYGRLWWLNGSDETVRPAGARTAGQLIPAAPRDLIAALGAMDRKLYIAPSRKLLVIRMGQAAPDRDFDQQLWLRLARAFA